MKLTTYPYIEGTLLIFKLEVDNFHTKHGQILVMVLLRETSVPVVPEISDVLCWCFLRICCKGESCRRWSFCLFLGEWGTIKTAGRGYKSHNCLLIDGQCNGKRSCASSVPPTASCDKQSTHKDLPWAVHYRYKSEVPHSGTKIRTWSFAGLQEQSFMCSEYDDRAWGTDLWNTIFQLILRSPLKTASLLWEFSCSLHINH